jgi:hypothetical protein
MKLFQKLLLAPAALGLMAPVAASASDLASAGGLNSYIQQNDLHNFRVWSDQNQVTNVQQFNDVKPTDWAYQALSNLIERYGCVAGYPNGTFKGGQAMTRFEAAALLNACLDRITETTDEIQRLQQDFAKELAVLKGRVDGLEKKVGKLEATQFSTTTKLQGDTYWAIGAAGFGGNNNNAVNGTQQNSALWGATQFVYDLRLNFTTSFTGKDLLYTRLRSGNFSGSSFSGNPYSLMALDRAYSSPQGGTAGNNSVGLDRLYYRFPIAKSNFTAAVGPQARNTEFLAIAPFYYDFDGLDFFRVHGAPGAYNKATGGLFGLIWKQNVKKGKPFFAASTSYVATAANIANTGTGTTATTGGIFGNNSNGSWLTQIGYQAKQWKGTFAWRYGQCGSTANRRGTQAAVQSEACGNSWIGGTGTNPTSGNWTSQNYNNSFALGLAWQPKKTGTLIPSISTGWGYTAYAYSNTVFTTAGTNYGASSTTGIANQLSAANIAATQSWTVALQWKDAFTKGNDAGMSVGQPSFVTSLRNGQTPQDGNYAWEWWYRFKVSDNISVTPLLFYLSNPSSAGSAQGAYAGVNGASTSPNTGANVFGGLLTAQFKF